MKIEARLEDGKPIVFYLEEIDHRKMIQCYAPGDGFSEASRGYIRSLKKPETDKELYLTFKMLGDHFLTLAKVYDRASKN